MIRLRDVSTKNVVDAKGYVPFRHTEILTNLFKKSQNPVANKLFIWTVYQVRNEVSIDTLHVLDDYIWI